MKKLILLSIFSLSACATQGTYNNQQVKTQCSIGYHQEYSVSTLLYNSENKGKNDEEKSRKAEEFRCVANSDQDKLLNPGHY